MQRKDVKQYGSFLLWVTTPRTMRALDEKDAAAFSVKHNISTDKLNEWVESKSFEKDVKRTRKSMKVLRRQEVLNAIYESAILKRDVTAQRLFLLFDGPMEDEPDTEKRRENEKKTGKDRKKREYRKK
jgi:hypothetical protein